MAPERSGTGGGGELRTRVLSAAILAPVALAAMLAGGLPFALLVIVVGAIAFWEWTAIGGAEKPVWARILAVACLAVALLAMSVGLQFAALIVAIPAVVGVLAGMARPTLRWMGLGLAYIGIPSAAFILFRAGEPFGLLAVLFLVAVVWSTDIAAYFGGRAIGGPKLWPAVSPKKTWSGAVSGLLAAVVAGVLAVVIAGTGSLWLAIPMAALLSAAAQAGDFFESAVKRHFGVKDSGSVIPGHGGVLDRVDGLFGAAALAWIMAVLGLSGAPLLLPAGVVPVAAGGP